MVIAARVADAGRHALPQIEAGLDELGINSAWRLMPDSEIGVASLPNPTEQIAAVVKALATGTAQVGVSPPYTDLRQTAQALRLARMTLRGAVEREPVMVFGQDMLGSFATIDPDLALGMAQSVLAGLQDLAPGDRELLLDTFGAWLDHNGSADEAAKALFVHPNTVRYRLRRLEERTGRLLSNPRCAAELSMAYEIDRRTGKTLDPAAVAAATTAATGDGT